MDLHHNDFLSAILHKHLQGESLSREEQSALDQWLSEAKINRDVFEQLQNEDSLQTYLEKRIDRTAAERAFDKFTMETAKVVRLGRWRRVAIAAAVVLLLSSGYLLFLKGRHHEQQLAVQPDIMPGKQGAILTLSDGRKVVLDSLGNGLVATQNGAHVILESGQLKYTKDQATTAEIAFNTTSTPKGRQFQLVLPDGTKVWMNAASSLTYPTVFTNGERKVSVTGEAYFEVAKNAAMPFKVTVNRQSEIQVLGTSFNVKAYTEEKAMETTLLEGSVAVKSNLDKIILNPSEQASVNDGGTPGISVQKADIEKVMAWKNGLFNFEGASLMEVMHQLSRWYDIEVVYETTIPKLEFGGKIRRDLTLAGLLKFLQGAGVHFRIEEGRRLIVTS